MFSNRWLLLFFVLVASIAGIVGSSAVFIHREFARLESVTESLFRSEETRLYHLFAKINDIHRITSRYFSTKRTQDYEQITKSIEELKDFTSKLDPSNVDILAGLDEIQESIHAYQQQPITTDQTSLELRVKNDNLNFALEKSAQILVSSIQTKRAWKILEMENSLDRLSTKASAAGGILFIGLIWQLSVFYRQRIHPLKLQVQEQELQMQAQEKLMSLALLASGVAHEIRSPLAAMKARLYTLKTEMAQNESAIEDHQAISVEIGRIEKIVNSFLQLARPADPEIEIVNTRTLVTTLVNERAKEYQTKGILIKCGKLVDQPVWADPDQLRQILSNLFQNAKDAISERGEITISSKTTTINATPAVRIDVFDTGKGIPFNQQTRLFDPFYTTKKSGTGLGLPLSQILIGKQGGRIAFRSQEGEGSCFSITIPTAPQTDE
ncbi:ATPase, histidine kinase-, DNA gyrase B-, and HSP90-like domain protein [Verrucomicrobiia bacterium DG1235]|nr:ATPase, histidine kinase-, DNA gyrase B-, and HSP90-like domain protein [Verrucomicrobiae bacterium DG1235]